LAFLIRINQTSLLECSHIGIIFEVSFDFLSLAPFQESKQQLAYNLHFWQMGEEKD